VKGTVVGETKPIVFEVLVDTPLQIEKNQHAYSERCEYPGLLNRCPDGSAITELLPLC